MNKKSYLLLADGFEEIEALATLDMMRRAGIETLSVSINKTDTVTGAHGISVIADINLQELNTTNADWLILPGGLPGATNLVDCQPLVKILKSHHAEGGRIAAICASPAFVLGAIGLLKDTVATCYPGCENAAPDVKFTGRPVEVTPLIITGRGPGYTMQFALEIIKATLGEDIAENVANGMLINE